MTTAHLVDHNNTLYKDLLCIKTDSNKERILSHFSDYVSRAQIPVVDLWMREIWMFHLGTHK